MNVARFDFFMPTKILFGRRRSAELHSIVPAGIERILVVTDRHIASILPALADCRSQLGGREAGFFPEVRENPDFANVQAGGRMARDVGAQLVIAIGGGSVLDAAKGIALLAVNPLGLGRILQEETPLHPALPVICLPTTSGSGSEVTPYAVFTDLEGQTKIGYANPTLFPIASILDPELTYSMPETLIVSSGLDALTHAAESYLSTAGTFLSDLLALHVIETVLADLEAASRKDIEAMDRMAYAAMLGGMVITHGGTILPHIMGYCLTMHHGVAHGRACAAMLPAVLDFLRERAPQKEKLLTLDGLFASVGGARNFIEGLGVSTRLSSYGVHAGELADFVRKVMVKSDIQITPAAVSGGDVLAIFQSAL
jgi:alcohol dehydrogenase